MFQTSEESSVSDIENRELDTDSEQEEEEEGHSDEDEDLEEEEEEQEHKAWDAELSEEIHGGHSDPEETDSEDGGSDEVDRAVAEVVAEALADEGCETEDDDDGPTGMTTDEDDEEEEVEAGEHNRLVGEHARLEQAYVDKLYRTQYGESEDADEYGSDEDQDEEGEEEEEDVDRHGTTVADLFPVAAGAVSSVITEIAGTIATLAGNHVAVASVGKWRGWKRALDVELHNAGGRLPWEALRDAVVKRYKVSKSLPGASSEELGWRALAAIPDGYLSKKDEYVKLTRDV